MLQEHEHVPQALLQTIDNPKEGPPPPIVYNTCRYVMPQGHEHEHVPQTLLQTIDNPKERSAVYIIPVGV